MVNIKVAVRIRPFSQREVNQKDEKIVETYDKSILVTNLKVPEAQNGDSRQRIRRFAVDFCYDPKFPDACTQESVYQDVGKEILDSMFDGYNACVLAYGHSASGKTYTMMGEEDDPGLTPRICQGLFQRMEEKALTARVRFNTVVSFLEIYNERVRDLLVSDDAAANVSNNFSLRVREHPKLGPYVQDLSQHAVNDEERILEYLAIGNSRRSTAATENNVHSSRSHAVFTIRFKQTDDLSFESELSSKVHLVDLAGSERAGSTQSKTRLKEGANINKSLVTLGNVISALAESCETFVSPKEQPSTKTWQPFVPYRDSVLTWLLKDTLGGNSNTIMIATVSPASSCLNETINTLRYAKRTKRIVNQPIVNEDPKIRTIRELREEIEKLRSVILTFQANNRDDADDEVSSSKCTKEEDGEEITAQKEFEDNSEEKRNGKQVTDSNVGRVGIDAVNGLDILPGLGIGNDENNAETDSANNLQTQSANSFSSDVSKINDEKKTDVNGSVIDKLVRESQVFSDSLESFSALRTNETQRNRGDFGAVDGVDFPCNFADCQDTKPRRRRASYYKTYKDNQFVPKISRISKLRIGSRKQARHRLRLYLKRECASLENLPKMLHRSRPDLIKGIAAHSKDGLPSTSSQSFTDVSGLSQSASENSLNSSGSVDSQDNKSAKCWPEKKDAKPSEAMQKSASRQSSIGDGSGSSTPTQIPKPVPKRRSDKRSEIVAAVTTRLYATKKKPDPRMEALQATEKDDEDDGELEELKLCKRARMKLFDLSRKLAMAKRIKKMADSDTQTDFANGTIRVKEKCVATDEAGVVQFENCGTNTEKPKKDKPIIMNQVFIPRNSNYVVECGKSVRVEVPVNATVKHDSGTQTIMLCKDQTTSPPNEEYFSDDSLEDEFLKWKKNCEMDSLELCANSTANNKSGVKSQSNETINKSQEPINYRRSYDSLIDNKVYTPLDKSWLPITRYPIAGTNALYEYDPNKSTPDIVYSNTGEQLPQTEINSQPEFVANEEPHKIRKTEIILPLFNGLPLAICTETVSSTENVADETLNYIASTMNRFLPNSQPEENASSDNSVSSSDGSDVTSSSETSSEDFVFYEGPKEKEPLCRQSGLGNLYTISENSELSDLTASDPSSPQPSQHSSLQILEQRREKKIMCQPISGTQNEGDKRACTNDYTIGVHVLRNPLAFEKLNQDEIKKSDSSGCEIGSSSTETEITATAVGNPAEVSTEPEKQAESQASIDVDDNKCLQKSKKSNSGEKSSKKINWADIQAQSQRQFLNFNIMSSSKQTPFTIDSNIFGDRKQTSEAKFPSEDSITFVFMGPNRQKTSMLMEIIKRTLGQGSDSSFTEKSHRKSRNRGVQCKLMRSVSVDTAMIALSRFAKHQRPTLDITRTSSLDTLVPEEMQTIIEQGRLHGMREYGCQCDIMQDADAKAKPNLIKYTTCTSTTRDQGTETDKCLDMTDKCSMTSSVVDASCDALEESEDNLFDEYFPPLPRTKITAKNCHSPSSKWKEIKDVVLGTADYLRNTDEEEEEEDKPKKPRKATKSVSWSDLSDCEETERISDAKTTGPFDVPKFDNSFYPAKDCLQYRPQSLDTRRVRFIEPQRTCMDEICQILQEKKDAAETAANVTAFLKEAVQLLKNLNNLSQIYDLTEEKNKDDECHRKSSLKKVETSVQTDGQAIARPKDISLSADSSPIRRARTSGALAERRDRKSCLNLTWPRQRPTRDSSAFGKPPTGLKYTPSPKSSRLSYRSPCPSLDFRNDLETSSTSTNWNISNMSTAFSNSYFGDSGCSRPSSSKSFYSDLNSKGQWSRPSSKMSSQCLQRIDPDLEIDLEESCKRLETAVERDRLREEKSNMRLSNFSAKKYIPTSWYYSSDTDTDEARKVCESSNVKSSYRGNKSATTTKLDNALLQRKYNYTRKKPCKCYCHYRTTNRVYRSSLELEAAPSVERHCHACCTPCETSEPERSSSAPALNSVCDLEGNKCRLFYYGYCPCSPVKLQHVKSSPRAYMQHLLSLRRQIVKNTYDSENNT